MIGSLDLLKSCLNWQRRGTIMIICIGSHIDRPTLWYQNFLLLLLIFGPSTWTARVETVGATFIIFSLPSQILKLDAFILISVLPKRLLWMDYPSCWWSCRLVDHWFYYHRFILDRLKLVLKLRCHRRSCKVWHRNKFLLFLWVRWAAGNAFYLLILLDIICLRALIDL